MGQDNCGKYVEELPEYNKDYLDKRIENLKIWLKKWACFISDETASAEALRELEKI